MILMVVGPEGRIRGKQRTLDAHRMVAFWVGASCTAIFYTTPWATRGKQNWKIGSHWKNLKAEEFVNYLLHEMHRGYKTQIIFLVLLCAWCQVIRNVYLGRHVQNSLPAYPHALRAIKRRWKGPVRAQPGGDMRHGKGDMVPGSVDWCLTTDGWGNQYLRDACMCRGWWPWTWILLSPIQDMEPWMFLRWDGF